MHILRLFYVAALVLMSSSADAAPADGELVIIGDLAPNIRVALRYATADNVTHQAIYPRDAKCYLRRAVAERLARVEAALEKQRLGLQVFDCYRPTSAQKMLWDQNPDRRYVADPKKGSRHGRGAAVDVTLVDERGHPLSMPTDWDDSTEMAHRGYAQLSTEVLQHSALLEAAMQTQGFIGLATEWWHFDSPDWQLYPQLGWDFERLSPLPKKTQQLVAVVSSGWNDHDATLTRFSRVKGRWSMIDSWPVVIGRGMAWGVGVHAPGLIGTLGGAVKREGDKRSPAGVFSLGEVTGYAATAPKGTTLRYRRATPRLYCVDDLEASEYNELALAPTSGAPSWHSTEPMLRSDALYARTIFVQHNPSRAAGAGSCIFVHVWAASGRATIGCTAMPLPQLETLIGWLARSDDPLMVALPREAWNTLAPTWGIPNLH